MEAMTSLSTICRPKNAADCSHLGTAIWTVKIAGLLVVFSAAALLLSYSLLFVLLSSPRSLWLAANLIIFAVWRLSGPSAASNHYLDDELLLPPPDIDVPSALEFESEMKVYSSSTEGGKYAETKDDAVVSDNDDDDDNDGSMDGTWRAIAAEQGTRPVLTKSETWERRPERTGTAVLRKSATCREGKDGRNYNKVAAAAAEGWRRREALVVAHDELFRQVESFIKKHYDHLKLQRQESELHHRFPEKQILNLSATFADRGAS